MTEDDQPRLFAYAGGDVGPWRVVEMKTVIGHPLADVKRLNVIHGAVPRTPDGAQWILQGVTSNDRYATRQERDQLSAIEPRLGRPEATCAALIPIRKTMRWWSLSQDERRQVFEDRSLHIRSGLKLLPAVARQLHHCRDMGEGQPFDFLTWFEYARADSVAFDGLVADLRASEEWTYVDREIDIRLERDGRLRR